MSGVQGLSTVGPPDYLVTHDVQRKDHIITDDQLLTLKRGGKDKSFDIAVAATGAALGFAQNFWAVVFSVMGGTTVGGGDFFGAAVFIVAFTTAILAVASHKSAASEIDTLVHQIRSRPAGRMPAQSITGQVV